ncbi:MAG: glycerophosphoryl diester phosphodiesterase membrane domain-containing protein [Sphingomonadales bacterium]|nr:glycerophosphoryl diester phosphodiesterase membrane domain-containing protein [Sphingomonadales bacterium]MBD3774377.1 glycerophosphoryl diester phosphodiesterase membrane domain-containing protein [Paracoccaceae bacterium]
MKLDMGKAWNDAMALVLANRDVVAVVAGVFFFLPNLAFALLVTNPMADMAGDANVKPEQLMDMLGQFYVNNWWAFVLLLLLQYVGMLGLVSLLTDRDRPTVAEALKFGAICLLPYLGAALLMSLAMFLVILVPVMIGAAAKSVAIGALLGVLAMVVVIYLTIKFSLIAPVMAMEKQLNPITALVRSWQLTKGNSLLLFAFYALLAIAFIVVSMMITMVFSLAFALMGAEAAMIGNGFVGSILNTAWVVVAVGVWVAIYRQLSGEVPTTVATFE